MLFQFWSDIKPEQCIHPDDVRCLSRYGHLFELGIPPGHVNGRLATAPVVVCYLNPGFEEADRGVFAEEAKRQALFDQITGEHDFPLWFERWRRWYLPRVRFGKRPDNEIARTVAIFNVCAYASRNANHLTPAVVHHLPSSEIARRYLHEVLLPQALRRERFVVIGRGAWAWAVDRTMECENVRFAPNPRGGHIGPAIAEAIESWIASRGREP